MKKPREMSESYSDKEAQERFDAALRGGLSTPHKPLKPKTATEKKRALKNKPEKKPGK